MNFKVRYHSLKDDPTSNNAVLNIKSHVKMVRFPRDKENMKHHIKDKSRTFSHLPLRKEDLNRKKVSTQNLARNLKQFKSLKCLKIDMEWLPSSYKSLQKLIMPLKHLKSLSLLHLHSGRSGSGCTFLAPKLKMLYKVIKEIPSLSKTEIRLSLSLFVLANREFVGSLKDFSKLRNLTSVYFTCMFFQISSIQNLIAPLKNRKSLSQLSLTLDECRLDSPKGLHKLLKSIRTIRSLKNFRIYFKKCFGISYPKLKEFVPTFRKTAQCVNLEMIFQVRIEQSTLFGLWSFVRSIKGIKARYKTRSEFKSIMPIIGLKVLFFVFIIPGLIVLLMLILKLFTN